MRTKFSGFLTLLLAFVVQISFAQEKTVTGTITDNEGLPLPGVNVLVQGTSTGTQSDFDGNYSIEIAEGETLVFSYVGFETQEILIGPANTYDVSMTAGEELEKVVITALGIKRKQDEITTANEVVDSETLIKANNPDVVQGLAGKVTGLTIKTTGNGVSGEKSVVLRGYRSVTGSNQALVVIDGAISTMSFLNTLDPNSIESFNVIKGANGAALYGSQGSNGVIMVTTKRGTKDGKMKVSVRSTLDFESVDYVPERQTRYGQGWDLGDGFENIVYENGGWGPEFDGQMVPVGLPQEDGSYIMAPYSTRGADHIKDFFKTGITQQNSVNISSGNDEGYVYFGAQNQQTEFVIENDKLQKSAFTFKGGKTLGKWQVNGSASYTYNATEEHYIGNGANTSLYADLLQTPSNVPVEAFANSGNEGHWNGYYLNPYWLRDNKRREVDANRFNVQADLQYDVNDNINIVLRTNGLFTFQDVLQYNNGYSEPQSVIDITGFDRSEAATFSYGMSKFQRYYTDLISNYDYVLSDDFTLKANVGANLQYTKNSSVAVAGTGLTVPGIYSSGNLVGDFTGGGSTGDSRSTFTRVGLYGQVDLGFKDYLFLNVTGRNDWSSVLDDTNNSFFYPSVGMSFIPTEAFSNLKGDVLNYAKVMASYVRVGNDGGINPYAINNPLAQAPGFPYEQSGNSFITPNGYTNSLIKPEFTTSLEAGVNLGFFKDRLTFDATYYSFNTTDLITNISTSNAAGISSLRTNIGEMEGWGTEINLGVKPIKTEDFGWNLNLGFTKNYSELVKLTDQLSETSLGGYTGFAEVFAVEGEQFPTLKGTGFARDDQGRVIIDPTTGNPQQSSELVTFGNVTPDYIVNLNTSFRYKGFTLSATMDYRTGHVFFSNTHSNLIWSGHLNESAQGGRGGFIYPNSAVETTPGSGEYVANTNVMSGGTTAGSYINFWNNMRNIGENSVLDATAFKLRELSLRYDVNPELLEKTFLTSVSVNAVARNLFTVLPEENKGYADPEANFSAGNTQGVSNAGQYPPTRSIGMGVNLTF